MSQGRQDSVVEMVILVVALATLAGATGEVPLSACDGKTTGDKVADPRENRKYYYCLEEGQVSERSLFCRQNHTFNASLGECVAALESATPFQSLPLASICVVECTGQGSEEDLIPSVFSCDEYYYCLGGNIYGPIDCPEERPYFNGDHCVGEAAKGNEEEGEEEGCCEGFDEYKGGSEVADERGAAGGAGRAACCHFPCQAFCNAPFTQVPDPADCHSFFICLEVGYADPDLHFPCPYGTSVNPETGRCVGGDIPCEICPEHESLAIQLLENKLLEAQTCTYEDPGQTEAAAKVLEQKRYEMTLNL